MYLVTIVIINLAMISDGKVICWTKLTSKPDINRKKQSIYIRTMNNSGDCNMWLKPELPGFKSSGSP